MPLGAQAIDALWYSLCPSFVSSIPSSHTSLRRGLSVVRSLSNTCPHARRSAQPSLCQKYSTTTQTRPPKNVLNIWYVNSDNNTPVETEKTYNLLGKASRQGHYATTQRVVKELVVDHGEDPNLKIYEALILANTSPVHGSIVEVQRILDEMQEERIPPDSSIYHAVLKVCKWSTLLPDV